MSDGQENMLAKQLESMEATKEIEAEHPFMKEHGLPAGVAGIKEDKQGHVFVPVRDPNHLKGDPVNVRQFDKNGDDQGFIKDSQEKGVFVLGNDRQASDPHEPAIIGTDFNDAASVH